MLTGSCWEVAIFWATANFAQSPSMGNYLHSASLAAIPWANANLAATVWEIAILAGSPGGTANSAGNGRMGRSNV